MEAALLSYGGCRGLVGGFYGEMSPNFDRLVKAAAAKGRQRAQTDGRAGGPIGRRNGQMDPNCK